MVSRKTPTTSQAAPSKKKTPSPTKSRSYAQRVKEKQQFQRQLLGTPELQSVIVNFTQKESPRLKTPTPYCQKEHLLYSPQIQSITQKNPNLRKNLSQKPPSRQNKLCINLERRISLQREKYRNLNYKYKALLNHNRASSQNDKKTQMRRFSKNRKPYKLIRKRRNDANFKSYNDRNPHQSSQCGVNLLDPDNSEIQSLQEVPTKDIEIDNRGLEVTQQPYNREMIGQDTYSEILKELSDIKTRLAIVENLAFTISLSK